MHLPPAEHVPAGKRPKDPRAEARGPFCCINSCETGINYFTVTVKETVVALLEEAVGTASTFSTVRSSLTVTVVQV